MSDTYETALHRSELNLRLKTLIAESLDLPVRAELIDDDQPLFGRGLELDSLDTLEIVSLVEENFSVYITDEDKFVFGSINRIADFIEEGQQK
ncbi:acyl carrier protein [Leifsonia sp. LS1]|uniref:acyl carrier protein n=1 Tax=Leifsonia sp. LS1 TaxID=2828483 RepID=UPI001CFC97A2|nr:phosphopantetheine-binding protein [Leifsonia sp. LS1]GIT78808.1 acyl carrier protein [Leifsonia sp. LS1]